MSDLADQILAVITTVELTGRLGDPPLGFILDGREHHPDDVEIVYETGRGERDAVLRRCAADREIVDRYRNLQAEYKNLIAQDVLHPGAIRRLEALIAEYLVVTLPVLARGYGIQQ